MQDDHRQDTPLVSLTENDVRASAFLYAILNDENVSVDPVASYQDWSSRSGIAVHDPGLVVEILEYFHNSDRVPKPELLYALYVDGIIDEPRRISAEQYLSSLNAPVG